MQRSSPRIQSLVSVAGSSWHASALRFFLSDLYQWESIPVQLESWARDALDALTEQVCYASRGKETSFLDARRTSARSVKRKAWVSSGGAPAQSERPHRLTPLTDSSASQHGPPSSGMLSPPDMVWPANTLAQVPADLRSTDAMHFTSKCWQSWFGDADAMMVVIR